MQGIYAKVLSKASKQELKLFLGNKNILTANHIPLPSLIPTNPSHTQIYMAINNQVVMVLIALHRLFHLTPTLILDHKLKQSFPNFKNNKSKCISFLETARRV
jgi:hypothetical protein